ncbi:hypothetical protein FOA52_011400 [Chlamydomonas sp. UWO 241]|nr:hypothetical protein FOA52_011400 [Chlamydomonas sp. UWO 241]
MPPPSRRDLKNLVGKLGANARPGQRMTALTTLQALCREPENVAAIAAAGAISPLLQLLAMGPGAAASVLESDSEVLLGLCHDAGIARIVAAAGAFPTLVQVLVAGTHARVLFASSMALGCLAAADAATAVAITATGAVPPLVRLIKAGVPADVQAAPAATLKDLAGHPENAVSIAAAGAIPPLVQMLGLAPDSPGKRMALGALTALAPLIAENAATIAAAGAIPPLVQLLGLDLQLVCRKQQQAHVSLRTRRILPSSQLQAPSLHWCSC